MNGNQKSLSDLKQLVRDLESVVCSLGDCEPAYQRHVAVELVCDIKLNVSMMVNTDRSIGHQIGSAILEACNVTTNTHRGRLLHRRECLSGLPNATSINKIFVASHQDTTGKDDSGLALHMLTQSDEFAASGSVLERETSEFDRTQIRVAAAKR